MIIAPVSFKYYAGYHRGQFLAPNYLFYLLMIFVMFFKLLKFILFADDTNIFNKGDNLEVLCKEISKELDKLHIWFDVNQTDRKTVYDQTWE